VKVKTRYLFFCLFLFNIGLSNAQESNRVIDSLLNIIHVLSSPSPEVHLVKGSDTSLINVLNKLSRCYMNMGDYEQSLLYVNDALQRSEKIDYGEGASNAHNIIGIIQMYQGYYEKALNSYQKSLQLKTQLGDSAGVATALNNIGLVYSNWGNYELSMSFLLKALVMREKIGDIKNVSSSYSNIGILYFKQGNYEKALRNYFNSLKLDEKLDDKIGLASCYNNIGIVYKLQDSCEKALENYFKALKINKELNNRNWIANNYINIGNIYSEQGKYKSALEYQSEALKMKMVMEDKQGLAAIYDNIGNIYLMLGSYDECSHYLKLSLAISKEIGSKENSKNAYFSLARLYEKEGDYERAFEYHKLYSNTKDSLLNEESSRQITEMNTKYESEKKEKDIQLLTKDKELQVAEIGRQKLIRNGFVGGLAVALLLAFVLLNRFQLTRRQKKVIEYQNSQIVESINYSKRIQDALLPSIESMQQAIPSLFVFYEPKNIVSGDFYFFKEFENYILLACVDCTGHGVPGGFMSTLGSLLLDKIANDENLKPSEILIKLSDEIVRVLHQQDGGEIQDGMDLSVCLIDRHNRQIEFSGARNGIIVITNNEARRYKGNPLPVGGNYMKKGVPVVRNFETQTISLNTNDWVYMYTDGFIEQIGGEENLPMNYEQFEKQLVTVSKEQTAEEKINLLNAKLIDWKGKNERTDDVLIIGFQVV
jgi:tetratricopeptide (TPR) repeat protein